MTRAPQGALLAVWNGADRSPSLELWWSELLAPPRRRPVIVEPGRHEPAGLIDLLLNLRLCRA